MCELACTWRSATSCCVGFFLFIFPGRLAQVLRNHLPTWLLAERPTPAFSRVQLLNTSLGFEGSSFEASESSERSFSCGVAQPPQSTLLNPAHQQLKREVKERELRAKRHLMEARRSAWGFASSQRGTVAEGETTRPPRGGEVGGGEWSSDTQDSKGSICRGHPHGRDGEEES